MDEIEDVLGPDASGVPDCRSGEFIDAVKHWPRVDSLELKKVILIKGIYFLSFRVNDCSNSKL